MARTNDQKMCMVTLGMAEREIMRKSGRSAWARGVNEYALELIDGLKEGVNGGWIGYDDIHSPRLLVRAMMNGASSWAEYSWGGCSLIYNEDIAKRLCNNTELKITKNGEKRPNRREEWLDVQARALYQAAGIVAALVC